MTSITISRQFITRLMLESIPPVPFSHLMRPVDLWSQDYCHVTKLIIQQLTICILSPLLLTTYLHLSRHVRCWLWMLGLPPPLLLAVFFRFFPREFSFPSFSFQIGFFPLLGRNFLCLNFSLHIFIVNCFCSFNIFPRLTSTSVVFIFLFPVQKRMVLSETPK